MTADRAEAGRQILGELWGPEFMAGREKTRNAFNGEVNDFIEEVNFGRIWAGDGIDRKMRLAVTLGILVALNRGPQLRAYIEAALVAGFSQKELRGVLMHSAIYCGLPAAVEAFRIAEEVLRARGLPIES